MKKNEFIRFYHRDAHCYVIISHNSSVPMIGHLQLATGTLTSRASWACLTKISWFLAMKSDFSQTPPSRSRFDCERISEDQIDRIFDYECNHCLCLTVCLSVYFSLSLCVCACMRCVQSVIVVASVYRSLRLRPLCYSRRFLSTLSSILSSWWCVYI